MPLRSKYGLPRRLRSLAQRFAFVAGNDELGTNITRLIVGDASANIEL
jgi:hypothetical protein